MKVFSNDKLISRNNKIGNFLSIASLVVLGVGLYFSFKNPATNSDMIVTFASFVFGLIMFQLGNYYLSKWGKSPRPDEILTSSLKGLDDKYSLYHYATPIFHLLVGPAGIYALLPYNQTGTIKYDSSKNRWRQIGGNFFLKLFGGEGLGRPESEVQITNEDLERYFKKLGVNKAEIKTSSLLVFTNDKAIIEGEGSPSEFTTKDKLKEFIRKRGKSENYQVEEINQQICTTFE